MVKNDEGNNKQVALLKEEISSLTLSASTFEGYLSSLDSFQKVHGFAAPSAKGLEGHAETAFQDKIIQSKEFCESTVKYLTQHRKLPVQHEWLIGHMAEAMVKARNVEGLRYTYEIAKIQQPKIFADTLTENGELKFTFWGHTKVFLSSIDSLKNANCKEDEFILKKISLEKNYHKNITKDLGYNPYNKEDLSNLTDFIAKYPKSKYVDDAEYLALEDCYSPGEGCAGGYIVYECVQAKEVLLKKYPDTDMRAQILGDLVCHYAFCGGCSKVEGEDENSRRAILADFRRAYAYLDQFESTFPNASKSNLDKCLKRAEDFHLWELYIKTNKSRYKMGEPIVVEVSLKLPKIARYEATVLGLTDEYSFELSIPSKQFNDEPLLFYGEQAPKTGAKVKPGGVYKETFVLSTNGSISKTKGIQRKVSLKKGTHSIKTSYISDSHAGTGFISEPVTFVIE